MLLPPLALRLGVEWKRLALLLRARLLALYKQ